jgi:glucans biosynthesis protein C
MNERKYYIDWVRVIAMLFVFLFHVSRLFDNEPWNIKAPLAQQSEVVSIVRGTFIWTWLMELFFLVAGYAAWYALKHRSGGQYLVERVKRLLVPLYTVGLFIILVPQVYFWRFTHGVITGTFWQWLPGYFAGLPGEIFTLNKTYQSPIALFPFNDSGHLWFIQMLFLISLITLPVLLYLQSNSGQRLIGWLARGASKLGGILLFVIPLAVIRIALNWIPMTSDHNWADFFWYALYFLFGCVLAGDARFTEGIKKHTWLCLALWLVPFIVIGSLLKFVLNFNTDSGQGFSLYYIFWQITYSLSSWCSVIFVLSIGARYLNFNHKFLAYGNEAVLPFYIFHQTIIQIVAWFVLPWEISAIAKFLIIAVVSFPVIMILYELFVRRIGFMRFLFGMAPKKPADGLPTRVIPATR